MNTLAVLLALLGSIWLSIWGFTTAEEDAIGYMGVGLILFCVVLVTVAIGDDIRQVEQYFSHRRGESTADDNY